MSKLEDKIKALLETKDVSEEDTILESVEELEEGNKVKMDKDGEVEVDNDSDKDEDKSEPDGNEDGEDTDDDGDGKDSDDETEVAKDKTKVNEGSDPFGALDSAGADEAGSSKTAKIKAGASKKDAAPGVLDADTGADQQDDAGDNAKIQKGMSQKDSGGKITDGATGSGVDAANAKNAVVTQPMKEHMDALFAGEELSEEFKTKTATLFEAAVSAAASARIAELEEEYQTRVDEQAEEMQKALTEAVEEVQSELVENIDGFLNFMVEQWIEENKVALERGMKLEMVDSFIDGLKTLFAEHYVDMPEEKLDVVETQAKEIDDLAEMVDALSDKNDSLIEELVALKKAAVLESVGENLTKVEADKFVGLCEGVEFTTEDEFKQKVQTIKEAYFPKGREVVSEETEASDNVVAQLASKITKNIRF